MTWAGLSAIEWVSYTAAQTSGLTQLVGLPTSDQWMTKSAAATYLSINTSWASYAAKSAAQWVARQDLVPPYQNSGILYYVNFDVGHNGAYGGWSSAALACAHSGALTVTVYWNGTLGNGTILYYANGLPIPSANTTDYYYLGGHSFTSGINELDPGALTVANYATCTPTMPFKVKNTNATAKTAFTAVVNAVSVTGMLAITLPGSGTTTTGSTVSEVVGANAVTLTGGASTKTISSIVDVVTLGAVSYTITSGNGTSTLVLSVTLTSANETNGILITIS